MDSTETKTTTAPAKPVRAKTTRLIRVVSLKPCELPIEEEGSGKIKYQMVYVSGGGTQVTKECSKLVYNRITGGSLDYHKKSDFTLTIDKATEVVIGIVEQLRPDLMPGFKREDPAQEVPKHLVLALYPDGSIDPRSIPDKVSPAILQEIIDAVEASDEDLKPLTPVGRFAIMERRELVGATELTIDPMPRQ